MTLGKLIKYISFLLLTLVTLNNISNHTLNANNTTRVIISITPYDLIISNDIKTLLALRDVKEKNILNLASSLKNIDQDIQVMDLQEEYIKIKRKYIYNKDINSHLIECSITIYQTLIDIEDCIYNEKIFNKITDITQPLNNQQANKIKNLYDSKLLSKKLITSIYEHLLSSQYYETYLKKYLGLSGITLPANDIDMALTLLKYTPQIDNIDRVSVKNEIKSEENYILSKEIEFNYKTYNCKTKVENKLLLLKNKTLRYRIALKSPPIRVNTICIDQI